MLYASTILTMAVVSVGARHVLAKIVYEMVFTYTVASPTTEK